jgi:hypothetical protein
MARSDDFSVVLGGPLYRLYRRTHLSGDSLELVPRRALTLCLFAWLPLLIITLIERNAWSGAAQPFLRDVDVHARLLLALPLLLGAERHVHQRMSGVARRFVELGLIAPESRPKFDAAVGAVRRVRESRLLEIALVVFVYGIGVSVIWRHVVGQGADTWYRDATGGAPQPTLAGWWYGLVSLPLFQFVLYRWYVRLGVWAWFLWKVSRCGLKLVPTHPDKFGGLGFLGTLCYAFAPLLLAHGVLFAGVAASGILFDGRTLPEYSMEIIIAAAFILLFVMGPLAVFVPTLVDAKRRGLRIYGGLAQRYVEEFEGKWIADTRPVEPLLGTPDIQSLADLSGAYENVVGMRLFPMSWRTASQLALVTLVPLAPLGLTMVTDVELGAMLLKVLF